MAAGIMPPEFGGEFSPCAPGCGHRDCEALHRRAAATCRHCGKAIGWDVRFYDEGKSPEDLTHVHALCSELDIEEDQRFRYLDGLRESGETNMFGAGAYLEEQFGIGPDEAKKVLAKWMQTFAERHPDGGHRRDQ